MKIEALQGSERELEQQKKQHNVAVDKLLLQTQSLENALKAERHVVIEERCVLTQTPQPTHKHTHCSRRYSLEQPQVSDKYRGEFPLCTSCHFNMGVLFERGTLHT